MTRLEVEARVGAFLPGIDPAIAEIVIATVGGNPDASIPELMVALTGNAPAPEIAVECCAALLELVVCTRKGHLAWIEEKAASYLVGIRRATHRDATMFGVVAWPNRALASGPPEAVTVRTRRGPRVVWAACAGLQHVVLRQSEVVALGNALVERFGARVIEDRSGPEVAAHSAIETNMTRRAKERAAAVGAVERLLVEARAAARADHVRVPIAEAIPGTLADGTLLHPEGDTRHLYEIERRVNESWVVAVSTVPGAEGEVEAGIAWVRRDGRPPADGAPIHAGFSDDPGNMPPPIRLGGVAELVARFPVNATHFVDPLIEEGSGGCKHSAGDRGDVCVNCAGESPAAVGGDVIGEE